MASNSARYVTLSAGLLILYFVTSILTQMSGYSTTFWNIYSTSQNSSELNRHFEGISENDTHLEITNTRKDTSNRTAKNARNKRRGLDVWEQYRIEKREFDKSDDRINGLNKQGEDLKVKHLPERALQLEGVSWTNGIFWSDEVEASALEGVERNSAMHLSETIRENSVIRMVPGCGHSQNRLLTFQNGCRICCRYRNSLDLILGEMYAYYLSQILLIPNLPPTTVGVINVTSSKWDAVRTNMTVADWSDGHQVGFSEWIPNLIPTLLPQVFLKNSKRLHPPDILGENATVIAQLIQWSDLIILDYLTGNMDRMVSMLVNQRWNSLIMKGPVHNLEKSTLTGQLIFLDNELSFIHSYRLLDRYGHFHKAMLKSLCIFRSGTVDRLQRLHNDSNVWEKMWDLAFHSQTGNNKLPKLSRKNIEILKNRLADVLDQTENCKQTYLH